MYDISVIVSAHRRIYTLDALLRSVELFSSLRIQVVVVGDRSHLEAVDLRTSVNEWMKLAYPDILFLESPTTRDWPVTINPAYPTWSVPWGKYDAASDALPYCEADLVLGPTEDDLFFLPEWDVRFMNAVEKYPPDEYVYVHRNAVPSQSLGDLYMTVDAVLTSTRTAWEVWEGEEKHVPTNSLYEISEHSPTLVARSILEEVGGYGSSPHKNLPYEDFLVYQPDQADIEKLAAYGYAKKVQTGSVLCHNVHKHIILF